MAASATTTPRKRAPSWQQTLYERMRAARLEHLEVTCGISPPPPDDEPTVAWLNTSLAEIAQMLEADGCDDSHEGVYALWEQYLAEKWPAKYDPPWKFQVFRSKKVLSALIEAPLAEAEVSA